MKQDIIVLALSIISILVIPANLYAQKNDVSSVKVGEVGGIAVTYSELKRNFMDGSIDKTYTLSGLKDFLPSFLDYKAKVLEAKEAGYFDKPALKQENQLYAKQAAYSFWLNNKIKPTNFEIYFKRYQKEVNASHLLISVPEDAAPEDTLYAYNKLLEARDKWIKGESFETLNNQYSTKRRGRSMGGPLSWISVGITVKEFEDVVFEMDEGEISMPFRTQFGYHVVKVHDTRDRTPSRKVSHIFVRRLPNQADTVQQQKINNAYRELETGRSWAEVTREFSEDNLSVPKEGEIGWISYGSRYNPGFIRQVMNLDPEVSYTKPITTNYGYHIFKIDSVESYSSREEQKQKIKQKFEKTSYFQKNNQFVVNWLRERFFEQVNESVLAKYETFLTGSDTTKIQNIDLNEVWKDHKLYSFEDYSFKVDDFHTYLKERKGETSAKNYQRSLFEDYVTKVIDEHLTEFTVDKFPEFSNQIRKYQEGLAVFQINDDHVWSAATVDTSRLVQMYDQNTEEYVLPKRYYYHLISARADSTLKAAMKFIAAGNHPDSLQSEFESLGVRSDSSGTFTESPFDRLKEMNPGEFSESFDFKKRRSVLYLNSVLPARKMTFREAFNKLLSDFQPVREKEWLNFLREKYNIKSYPAKLEQAFIKDRQS